MTEIKMWRSPSFVSLVHCDRKKEEVYQGQAYLNYRQLLVDNQMIAILNDDGFWQSRATGQLYSDISFG